MDVLKRLLRNSLLNVVFQRPRVCTKYSHCPFILSHNKDGRVLNTELEHWLGFSVQEHFVEFGLYRVSLPHLQPSSRGTAYLFVFLNKSCDLRRGSFADWAGVNPYHYNDQSAVICSFNRSVVLFGTWPDVRLADERKTGLEMLTSE
jgi:hypothetical protein